MAVFSTGTHRITLMYYDVPNGVVRYYDRDACNADGIVLTVTDAGNCTQQFCMVV